MNKYLASLFYIFIFISLTGLSACDKGKDIEFTILHTNDIHSHLKPYRAESEKNPYGLGGLARLKTLVDQIRSTRANTVLLDAGDWSEGSMHYAADSGSNVLRLMSEIGYDAAVVGNHDFLNGPDELKRCIERANPKFPLLGANKNMSLTSNPAQYDALIKNYHIITLDGLRIGIIGIMTDEFLYYSYFRPGIITNGEQTAIDRAKELHENNLADVIVLLSHNGITQNIRYAQSVPWVNVVVSGHAHEKTTKPIVVSNGGSPAYVVEAKEWAQFLGDLTLVYNTKSKQVTLKNYTQHPVSPQLSENAKIAAMVKEQDDILAQKFGSDVEKTFLGECLDEMPHSDHREVPLSNMAAESYRMAAGTHLGLESVQLTGLGLSPGPISLMDAFNVQPHVYGPTPGTIFPNEGRTWTLKQLSIRGIDLRALLNVALLAESKGIPLGWISFAGARISYTKNPSNGVTPITSIKIENASTGGFEPLNDFSIYTLALHDGLLLGLRELVSLTKLPIDISNVKETGIETWRAVSKFIETKQTIRAKDYSSRYRTADEDLSFSDHHVVMMPNPDGPGYVFKVRIENEGLTPSTADRRLQIFRGEPNDIALDAGYKIQLKTPVGQEVSIPSLLPGQSFNATVYWNEAPKSGIYEFLIHISGKDGNNTNNAINRHFKI